MSKMCGVIYYLPGNVKNVHEFCVGLHKSIKAGEMLKNSGIWEALKFWICKIPLCLCVY